MIKRYKQFPEPLQKQILVRFGYGIIFLFFDVAAILMIGDLNMFFIGLVITGFCFAQALWLYYIVDNDKYIVISGICCDMSVTPIKRRIKSLLVKTIANEEEIFVRVNIRKRLYRLQAGARLHIYVANNTWMHEKDGEQHLLGYLEIDLNGKTNLNY